MGGLVASMVAVRGILALSGYVPYRRLDLAEVKAFFGSGGGKGSRAVASHDEDSTTMAVEASRLVLRSASVTPDSLWFATANAAYLDKNNASAIHAALQLSPSVAAFDFGGAQRSGFGAFLAALAGGGTQLLAVADSRDGLPTSADEAQGGDGASALLIGEDSPEHRVIAKTLASASLTDEFAERWRSPGERRSRVWEERFGEQRYTQLGKDLMAQLLERAGISIDQVDHLLVTGLHSRAVKVVGTKAAAGHDILRSELAGLIGQTGCAHPLLALADQLERAKPGERIVLMHLADGADGVVLEATDAIKDFKPARSVANQVANSGPLPYAKFLTWRQMVTVEPPRRPEPQRVSSSAAWRSEAWKFGFVGSRDRANGQVVLPPSRVSHETGAVDEMDPVAMAEREGTIVTFTIDRLAYSPSPPIVFAIVDFDGGGRFPIELTDVDAEQVAIGARVGMTFRRLFTSDGIHDYFWKGKLLEETEAKHG